MSDLKSLRYEAPADLRRQLASIPVGKRSLHGSWLVAVLGVAAALWVVVWSSLAPKGDGIVEQIAGNHVRSLMADHLFDVASTDRHTVKPWFAGKLDFAPVVIDLAEIGYPLVGGRLDYASGRRIAAVVYQRDQHVINLFSWPSPDDDRLSFATSQGYNLWHWTKSGMSFYAVSDLNANDLRTFAEKIAE